MVCNKCGGDVKDGASFCPNCGAAVKGKEEDRSKIEKNIHTISGEMNRPDTTKLTSSGKVNNKRVLLFLIPVLLLIIIAVIVISAFSNGGWKRRYIKYFKEHDIQNEDGLLASTRYALVDVNEDGIPEIFSYDENVTSLNTNANILIMNKDGDLVKSSLGRMASHSQGVVSGTFDEESYFWKEFYPHDEDFEDIDRPISIEAFYAIDADSGKLIFEHEAKKSDVSCASFIDGVKISDTWASDFDEYYTLKNGFYDQSFKTIEGADYNIDSKNLIKEIKNYKSNKNIEVSQKEKETEAKQVQRDSVDTTVGVEEGTVTKVGSEVTLTEEQKNGILELIKTLAWMKYGDESASLTKDGDFIASFVLYSANKSDSIIDNYDGAKEGFQYGNHSYNMSIAEDSLKKYLEDSIGVNDITVLKDWVKQNEVDFSRTHLLNCKDGVFLLNPPDSGDFDVSEPVISKVTTVSKNEILIEGSVEEIKFMDESVLSKKQFQITMTVNPDSIWGGYVLKEIKEWKSDSMLTETMEWKQAYINYLNANGGEEGSYSLIYIDEDDIPEVLYYYGGLPRLYTYYNNMVQEEQFSRGIFSYIEKSNMFLFSPDLSEFGDTVYELINGIPKVIVKGSSVKQCDENGNEITDNNGVYIFDYYWNSEAVTAEEYNSKLREVFDWSIAKAFYGTEGMLSFNELIRSISDGGNSGVSNLKNGEYILPESNSRYLSEQDLSSLSKEQLRLARNEIYARHGLIFTKDDTKQYFVAKSWYKGTVTEVTDDMFNEYEIANRDLIISMEERGQPAYSNSDVENEVKQIREWFTNTQNSLSNYISGTVIDNGEEIESFFYEGFPVKMILKSGHNGWNYSREYYFKDQQMYFAFVFHEKEEYRLYFKDEELIRYIDSSGAVNNYGNLEPYNDIKRKVTDEVKRIYPDTLDCGA